MLRVQCPSVHALETAEEGSDAYQWDLDHGIEFGLGHFDKLRE